MTAENLFLWKQFFLGRKWELHARWAGTTIEALVADPVAALEPIGSPDAFFVRPDSPLKPFSGRVLRRDEVSFEALDHCRER